MQATMFRLVLLASLFAAPALGAAHARARPFALRAARSSPSRLGCGAFSGNGGGGGRASLVCIADGDGGGDAGRLWVRRLRAAGVLTLSVAIGAAAIDLVGLPLLRTLFVWLLLAPLLSAYALDIAAAAVARLPQAERVRRRALLHTRMAPRLLAAINCMQFRAAMSRWGRCSPIVPTCYLRHTWLRSRHCRTTSRRARGPL
mmetsp:Transcript_33512/g.78830  ORF Transcript_33512/g.78830 Transcript_33512/m.78830 type:complete len:202 (+) Transcript_33512:33-638(+)